MRRHTFISRSRDTANKVLKLELTFLGHIAERALLIIRACANCHHHQQQQSRRYCDIVNAANCRKLDSPATTPIELLIKVNWLAPTIQPNSFTAMDDMTMRHCGGCL